MKNFEFHVPTKVVFGRRSQLETGRLLREQGARKVLVHYGMGSVQKSGLLEEVVSSIHKEGIKTVELGGVVANPGLSMVRRGVELCRNEKVDFILAVGGGSAIDSAKAIGLGVVGTADVWEYFTSAEAPQDCLPVGVVLTIAAAGSETSLSVVITNEETGEKLGLNHPVLRPRFAVMNPELTQSLPVFQTACGIADILMHTMERYFTDTSTLALTDALAEGLLRTVIENSSILTREPENYRARAEIMWAGSLSHNGITGCGGGHGDWATHQLAAVLGGRFNTTHGASLTAVWGSWARYVYRENPERFARFAEKVLEIPQGDDVCETALAGIEEMESYFWGLGLPTSLLEADIAADEKMVRELAAVCSRGNSRTIGAFKALNEEDMIAIYRMAMLGPEE